MGFSDVFKKAFPFISAAASLGGPLGTMAANAVGTAIGVDKIAPNKESIADAIAAATSKDPEAMLKLKQAEQDFQIQMAKLGFDDSEKILSMDAADRTNARAREIAVRDRLPMILALCVTSGFFLLLAMLAYHAVPPDSAKILDVMVGSLGTAWIGVINYYFGSSAGSAQKTNILAQQGK